MTLYHAQLPKSFNHFDYKGNESIIARMSRFLKTLRSRLGISWAAIIMARAKSSARITWFGNNNRNAGSSRATGDN